MILISITGVPTYYKWCRACGKPGNKHVRVGPLDHKCNKETEPMNDESTVTTADFWMSSGTAFQSSPYLKGLRGAALNLILLP
jgi:hypothetical protein